jgi:hypothetical protein
MKDHIAELKSQCIVREQRGTNAFDSYMVDRFDTEKFAELVVQECISNLCLNGYDDAADQLTNHFLKE